MQELIDLSDRLSWLNSDDIKPYVICRKESRVKNPGKFFNLKWFHNEPLMMDPLKIDDVYFSNALMNMEAKAFQKSDMAMPRWVFYDCSIMPGFISGFAMRTSALKKSVVNVLGQENLLGEWTPISMFIIIPTMVDKEWVAHNLSSINALVPAADRLYGLGFLSKAFGLSWGNIEVACGMTQWTSPAIRLHSHYGFFEVLTAYTPAHSYAKTLTYRLKVSPSHWIRFFTKEESLEFQEQFEPAGFEIDPTDEKSLIDFHRMIERKEGPFYLDSQQVRTNDLKAKIKIYRPINR